MSEIYFSTEPLPSSVPETSPNLKKSQAKFTRGKSIAIRVSPQSPDYDYEDDFSKKNCILCQLKTTK